MPFTKFTNSSYEQSHTNDPDNLPIFLIPGILGNGNELYSLAAALNEQRQGRTPIYIYEEPIVDGEPHQMSLADHAASMAQEILEIRQNSPLPYILAGYSFGGILAAEISRQLLKRNYDPHLYIIDEPAESCVKKYFDSDSDNFKEDLVSIVNYAATLSGMQPMPQATVSSSWQYLDLEDRIDQLANATLNQQQKKTSEDNKSTFYTHLEIAKRNLRNIALADSVPEQKLNNPHLIFTNEIAQKYTLAGHQAYQFTGEWDQCSDKVTRLNQQPYSRSHMDLLKEGNKGNAKLVANQISNSLKREITKDLLIKRQMHAILGTTVKPEQVDNILSQLIGKNSGATPAGSKRTSMQFFSPYNPANASKKTDQQQVIGTNFAMKLTH